MMNRNLIIYFALLIFMPLQLSAQSWEKILKYGVTNELLGICQTQDSSIWTTGFGATHTDSLTQTNLYKLNPNNGENIFFKSLDLPLGLVIKPTSDNGVLLVSTNNTIKLELNKIDKNGNILWSRQTYELEDGFLIQQDLKEVTGKNIFLIGYKNIYLFNENGNLLWERTVPDMQFPKIQYTDNNRLIFTGIVGDKLKAYEYDYNGSLLTTTTVYTLESKDNYIECQRISDTEYICLESNFTNDDWIDKLFKINNQQIVWSKSLNNAHNSYLFILSNFIIDKQGNIVLWGNDAFSKKVSDSTKDEDSNGVILILDSNGNFKSSELIRDIKNNSIINLCETNDGYYAACGLYQSNDDLNVAQSRVIKTKATKNNNIIFGKIILDGNNNCKADSLDIAKKYYTVSARDINNQIFYGQSDNTGNYTIYVDTGKYNLKLQIPSPYYYQNCDGTVNVKNVGVNQNAFDLFLQQTQSCPYLTVDLGSRAFRPCFDNVLIVNFCNHGTTTAQNAYIEVQLDPNLTYQSSSIAAINMGNEKYRFNLGNLPIDSCGIFTITAKTACNNSLLGKTLCNTAHIFPDSLCTQDQGKIKVNGVCNGNMITFDIKNESDKLMGVDKNYIVIEDHVMFKQGTFKLNANETKPITIDAKPGKTYRLIAEQTNPIYGSLATTALENCNVSTSPSTGFINQFAQGDDSPFEDIDCRIVTASYDPNDKQAVPQGVQNQHYIAKNTDLEYTIRFQNKGTDTAFTVIIKDTLSQHLDPATIQPGASSHPYRFDLTDKGIAKFIFTNIQLPHQQVNDEGSNGFVKFRIKQLPDLPNGTVIKNKAAIYFDFNDPIITNETFHTISENWLMIVPTKEIEKEQIEVKIFPNPFSESTTIELDKAYDNLILNIYDTNGRLVRSEKFNGNRLEFERNGLDSGIYIYDILTSNKSLQKGKVVIF